MTFLIGWLREIPADTRCANRLAVELPPARCANLVRPDRLANNCLQYDSSEQTHVNCSVALFGLISSLS